MHTNRVEQILGHAMDPAPAIGPYELRPSPAGEPGYPLVFVMKDKATTMATVVGEANARRVAAGLRMLDLMTTPEGWAESGDQVTQALRFAGIEIAPVDDYLAALPMAADMDLDQLESALERGLVAFFTLDQTDAGDNALGRLEDALVQIQPPSTIAELAARSAAAPLLAFERGFRMNGQDVVEVDGVTFEHQDDVQGAPV